MLTFYTCVKGVKRSLEVLEYCVKLRVLVPVELPYEGSSLSLNGKQTRISPHLSFLSTCLTCHPWRLSPKRVNQAHGFTVCPLPFPSSPPRTLSSSSLHSTVKATVVVFSLLSLFWPGTCHTHPSPCNASAEHCSISSVHSTWIISFKFISMVTWHSRQCHPFYR